MRRTSAFTNALLNSPEHTCRYFETTRKRVFVHKHTFAGGRPDERSQFLAESQKAENEDHYDDHANNVENIVHWFLLRECAANLVAATQAIKHDCCQTDFFSAIGV